MGKCRKLLLIASVLFTPLGKMLSLILYPVSCMHWIIGLKRGVISDLFLSCEGNKSHKPSLQADKRVDFTSARIPQGTGVPNDGFLVTTLKTLFRLFRVLLDL